MRYPSPYRTGANDVGGPVSHGPSKNTGEDELSGSTPARPPTQRIYGQSVRRKDSPHQQNMPSPFHQQQQHQQPVPGVTPTTDSDSSGSMGGAPHGSIPMKERPGTTAPPPADPPRRYVSPTVESRFQYQATNPAVIC